jgi:hypothetical protein
MSPITRYGFALFIGMFGIYQIRNEQLVTAGIAIVLAIAIAFLGRRS